MTGEDREGRESTDIAIEEENVQEALQKNSKLEGEFYGEVGLVPREEE